MATDGIPWLAALLTLPWHAAGQLIVAAVVGGMLGRARRVTGQTAGRNLTSGVALGACGLLLVARYGGAALGPAHTSAPVAGLIVLGSGVLGLRLVVHHAQQQRDVGHAATVWLSAALGLAVGMGQMFLAVFTALFTIAVLGLAHTLQARVALHRCDNPCRTNQDALKP